MSDIKFINKELTNTFKNTGLNNFDLATTKIYKGVKPMWEQLGFQNSGSNVPTDMTYWQNIIPNDFTIINLSGIENVSGSLVISSDEQNWEDGYLYPILPSLNESGIFDEPVNVDTSYGDSNASITNVNDRDENIILNVDFDQTTTDDLSDKTNLSKVEYNQDFELSLDEDLRLKIEGLIIPDGIEKNKDEQAF
tara:strand:+ start:4129 stop:4710 length:582 start_codon:yes stop_codon:yes gene_type:complete